MNETWKYIVGYEGRYMVSNLGNVMSLRFGGHNVQKLLKPTKHKDGYYTVQLGKKPKRKIKLVHVAVAEAFISNPDGKRFVNHIDGNKGNNCVENLEWVTAKENVNHAITTGLRNPHNAPKRFGKDNCSSKAVLQYDKEGRFVKKWDCQSDVARYYGVTPGAISTCINKPTKLFHGYMFVSSNGEVKEKIGRSQSRFAYRAVLQMDADGNVVQKWDTCVDAATALGLNAKYIRSVCRGEQKTHGGYRWAFAD